MTKFNGLTNNNANSLISIDKEKGFVTGSMSTSDLEQLKCLVYEQYINRLNAQVPKQVAKFHQKNMNEYHELSSLIDHQSMWPKNARILGPNAVTKFKSLQFIKDLYKKFNIQAITSEDGSGWEEVYWRIVRPGNTDIGDMHADKWFWDLGHGVIDKDFRRIKIWIALEVVPQKSGLKVIPYSQLSDDYQFYGEKDHTGKIKPKLAQSIPQADILNVSTNPGDFILFHDELLHGGMSNISSKTRVSLEATFLIKKTD